MLNKTDLKNPRAARGKGAANVARYLFDTEYYTGADEQVRAQNQWIGEGARALGLGGAVEQKAFAGVLEGYGPTGEKLAQNAGDAKRRLGFDLTFSADKSVTLLFVGADGETRDALMKAHHAAAEKALGFLQTQLEARRGHGGAKRQPVAGLVIGRFDHFSTRELDPDLHSHYVVANTALAADGSWGGFDAEPLEAFKHAAGALYRAELSAQVRGLGFGLDSVRERDADGRETGQVWHRVAGVGDAERKHFSKRRQQILDYVEEHGVSAQEACLRTRQGKEGEPDPEHTIASAKWQMDELRHAGRMDWETAADLRGRRGQGLDPSTDADTLERLHKTESYWTKAQLIDRLAKDRGGELGADGVLAEVEDFLTRVELVELRPDEHGRERWASRTQFELEQAIGERARLRAEEPGARVDATTVAQAIAAHEQAKGFTLTDEQRHAVRWVASDTGGVACLSGWAGTGKTATAGAYIKAWEMDGRRVLGTCAAWDAAEKLRSETGLETFSTASLLNRLDHGREKLDSKSVVLVDEAGMVGAQTIARLQAHTDAVGAKLVLIGDPLQLQPVEAGAGFALAMRATGEARQTEIRRQQQEENRELARQFYGGATGADLLNGMEQRGQLRTADDQAQARVALVVDYLADPREAREKLVIAPTNAQVVALTGQIRAGLKAGGALADGQRVEVRGKLQGETRELEIAPGDRLRFGLKDRRLGVVNGDIATVEKIAPGERGGHCLTVRLESDQPGKNARSVEVQTATYSAFDYGYAGTVHKAQGQGREAVYWLAQGKTDRHMGLVAYTRQKVQLRAYTTDAGRDELAAGLDSWRAKQSAVDLTADRAGLVKHGRPPTPSHDLGQAHALGRALRTGRQLGPAHKACETAREALGEASLAQVMARQRVEARRLERAAAEREQAAAANDLAATRQTAEKGQAALGRQVKRVERWRDQHGTRHALGAVLGKSKPEQRLLDELAVREARTRKHAEAVNGAEVAASKAQEQWRGALLAEQAAHKQHESVAARVEHMKKLERLAVAALERLEHPARVKAREEQERVRREDVKKEQERLAALPAATPKASSLGALLDLAKVSPRVAERPRRSLRPHL